jgi:hypothetical protein
MDVVELPSHKSLRPLTDPAPLAAKLAGMLDPAVEMLTVDVGGGVVLDGWMLKPRSFDPSRKYPVIVHVYGEPAGQTVLNRWGGPGMLFHRTLAEAGYVVASFDNRGTPAPKGAAWRKIIYGSVGDLSSKEQAAAIRALAARHSFVDLERVGIWGWSGGGTNTLHALFRFPKLNKVGVAVALQARFGDQLRRRPSRQAAPRPRLGRRQRPLSGDRAAGESSGRARQAVRSDGVSEPLAFDRGRPRDDGPRLPAHRPLFSREPAAAVAGAIPGRCRHHHESASRFQPRYARAL